MPGLTGPPPKREEERRRRNKTTEGGAPKDAEKIIVSHEDMEDVYLVAAPSPNPDWHPLAAYTYWCARRSAIREFFEPSDWAVLMLTCEQISRGLEPQKIFNKDGILVDEVEMPITGQVMNAILKALGGLMFLEGDRRKLRLEIERVSGSAADRHVEAPTGENVIDIRSARLGGNS